MTRPFPSPLPLLPPLLLLLAICTFSSATFTTNVDLNLPLNRDGFVPFHYSEWKAIEDASLASAKTTVHLALKQRNLDILSKIHEEISDPNSPQYGRKYTRQEVLDLVSPTQQDIQRVFQWIDDETKSKEISIDFFGDALRLTASVEMIEKLFSTKLKRFQHVEKRWLSVIRQEFFQSYSLPSEIQPLVELVTGLSDFPYQFKKKKAQNMKVENDLEYDYIVPDTVRELYSIPKDFVGTNSGENVQVTMEFDGVGFPSIADWKKFAKQANETYQGFSAIIHREGGDDGESTLDIQYLGAIGANVSTWYWTTHKGWAYEMALDVFNHQPPPTVVSVSYSWPELETCQSSVTQANCTNLDAQTYVARANVEFQKTGLLRVSFLMSSGDTGAPSPANNDCSLDETNHPVFGMYPCSSPFVTCVSAVVVGPENNPNPPTHPPLCAHPKYPCSSQSNRSTPCTVGNTEYAWTTGGGFSEFSPRPTWQNQFITNYLLNSSVTPPPNKFNDSMQRGYPDVSTVGDRILIIENLQISVTSGTSASAPIFAGMISLLNEWRIQNNKTALGFLNPILYSMAASNPDTFTDVTEGNNKCTEGYCCQFGFEAAEGWDAVTGLGTPVFNEMLQYVQQLKN